MKSPMKSQVKPQKIRGLILREYDAGESDKRLEILAKGHGRLWVYARGARKHTSKFLHGAQSFTYADFVVNQGRGFHALSQVEIIESFYPLREDYDRLMAAYQIVQACHQTLWDNIESDDLLLLVLVSLQALAKGQIPPLQVLGVFFMRFFDVFGLRPGLSHCAVCDTPASHIPKAAFCDEGLVCYQHKPLAYAPISPGALAALGHMLDSGLKQAFLFNASTTVLGEIKKAWEVLWQVHFEKSPIYDKM